jgi:uncharacterized repeat protein (TIGR03803 family)
MRLISAIQGQVMSCLSRAPASRVLRQWRFMAVLLGTALAAWQAGAAQHGYQVLHHFDGRDGAYPGGLIAGGDGRLYGNTLLGGGSSAAGTVYAIDHAGNHTLLRTFSDTNFNGTYPEGELTWGPDGRLYGVANADGDGHCGTVFAVTPGGAVDVVHQFRAVGPGGPPGCRPEGGVVWGADGGLRGQTSAGGLNWRDLGTVFKIDAAQGHVVLHSFGSDPLDGTAPRPSGPPVLVASGVLYGVTSLGGAWGQGTLYAVQPDGQYQVVHAFGGDDLTGRQPSALTLTPAGHLYGVATLGGANGAGTVFRLKANGRVHVLHAFGAGPGDGAQPVGRLLLAADGNLYGTTRAGGSANLGTVFRLSPKGRLVVLHSFTGGEDGRAPEGGLAQSDDGRLYGATRAGGHQDLGVVFSLQP